MLNECLKTGCEIGTYTCNAVLVEAGIVGTTAQRRDLTLGSVVPHIIERWEIAPSFWEQDFFHLLDNHGVQLSASREGSPGTGYCDVEVQVGDCVCREPGEMRLYPFSRALQTKLLCIPRTKDAGSMLVTTSKP